MLYILGTRTSLGRSVRTAYLQRTVATQVEIAVDGGWGGWLKRLASIAKALPFR